VGFQISLSQCPTVLNTNQSFCDVQISKVSDLSATANGNGIRWYATATATVPLSNTTELLDGTDYYVDDNSGSSCVPRKSVRVSIFSAPTGQSFQGVCVSNSNNATIANLIANGNGIKWYSVSVGGSPLASSTVLVNNTIYYASQTNPNGGCESSRLSVFVNVQVILTPTGDRDQFFCKAISNPPTISDLVASGNNNWYSSINSPTPLSLGSPILNGHSYFATTVAPPCESDERLEVIAHLSEPNIAGNSSTVKICSSETKTTAAFNLFSKLGGNPDTVGIWTGPISTLNGPQGTLDLSSMIVADSPYIFTYTVSTSTVCPPGTATVTLEVLSAPNAGTSGSLLVCTDSPSKNLFLSLGGSPETGGSWSPALNSGTGFFDPKIDAPGLYFYTVKGVSPCLDVSSAVSIVIVPISDAGISGTAAFCMNSNPADLILSLGGSPQAGGIWSPALASGSGLFNPSIDTEGIYTYTLAESLPCNPLSKSATVSVKINPVPYAGTNGSLFFCSNAIPSDLFLSLGGSPQLGGIWSPSLASGSGIFNPKTDLAGNYTYTVGGTLCSSAAATVNVSVGSSPNAGGEGATLLIKTCESISSVALFTALNGTQDSGIWEDTDHTVALNNATFNPSIVGPGTFHFTYTASGGIAPCLTDSVVVSVVVSPVPNAGTFVGLPILCSNLETFDLFSLLSGYQSGGIWTNANNQTVNSSINISSLTAGTYSYTYKITNTCAIDSENVSFSIVPNPVLIATNISVSSPKCIDTDVLISFSNMADGNYTLEYDLSGSTILNNQSASFTIIGGVGNFILNKSIVPIAGSYTIHFLNIGIVGSLCSSSLSNLSSNFTTQALSNLDNSTITIANNCLGTNAIVQVSNAKGIPDGNYEFNYTLSQLRPISGSSGVVSFLNGIGQFEIPTSLLSNIGTYSFNINAIQSVSLACDHSIIDASTGFEVFPLLNVSGAKISAANSCFDFSNEVSIRGATNLIDGNYSIIYELSGSNSSVNTLAVSFINGNSSFIIPTSNLRNAGIVHLSIKQLHLSGNPCGASGTIFNSINFEVFKTNIPQLISNGNEFCNLDNPTISSLSSTILGTETVFWFDAALGGTAYSISDLLENDKTYYASFVGSNGCESSIRLEVSVDLTKCTISIPDGFSPNGDGINDQFIIKNLTEVYPNFKLEIYNRYGNLLYRGNQNTPKWDGTTIETGMKVGDSSLAVGVYFYVLEFNDGILNPKQGRIYLSR